MTSLSPPPIAAGPWRPVRESIAEHRAPDWYDDAKLGLLINWGLYSVPGWAPLPAEANVRPDEYLRRMHGDPRFREYHAKTWGAEFKRDDFLWLFMAREYEPEGLVELAGRCGVKYIVPVAKHFDGLCLWPCGVSGRDSSKIGPQRDLIAPLADACREAGLKLGAYLSLEEWEYPLFAPGGSLLLRTWDGQAAAQVGPYDPQALSGRITGKRPVGDYARDYLLPQTLELMERYDPDLLWLDGDWTGEAEAYLSLHMAAHFYNRAEGRKTVAMNDRLGGVRGRIGDFFTHGYDPGDAGPPEVAQGLARKWELCRSIGSSFGYNRQETERDLPSATQLIHLLADTVAKNGNLLLAVNLNGEGGLPEIQAQRLEAIGRWLAVNGEAIHATRPWKRPGEGAIRMTQSKDGRHLYAICLEWPGTSLVLPGVSAAEGSQVSMLGVERPLAWRQAGDGLRIDLPGDQRPCEHAWVVKVRVG